MHLHFWAGRRVRWSCPQIGPADAPSPPLAAAAAAARALALILNWAAASMCLLTASGSVKSRFSARTPCSTSLVVS
eukprot:6991875-Pyramimonas_sp.AAC.1